MTLAPKTQPDSLPTTTKRRGRVDHKRPVLRSIEWGIRLLLVFALAFLAIGAAYQRLGPPRFVPGLTPKLRHLEQNRGNFDLVIFGSSRIFRGFVSLDFDRLMTEAGHPIRSFNLGVDGMSPPESFYTVRQVIAQGARPKWMLIELGDLRTLAEFSYAEVERYVHWHDLRHTWLAVERLFRDDRLSFGEKLRRAAAQLYLALVRNTRRGHAAIWLQPILNPPRLGKIYVEPTPWVAAGGFSPIDSKPFEGARRALFETVVKTGMTNYRTTPLPPSLRRAAADLVRDVRAAGIEPVFVITPTVHGGEGCSEVRSQGVDAPLISFTDMRRYPDLYRTDWHRDDVHLTEVGARALTAHLVEEFRKLSDPALTAPVPR